jgi:translocation and assembly module TamB
LARFSAISGQDLSGALQASLSGTADPLSGAFDIALSGTGRDLRAAPSVPEGLLAGETRLDIEASRDTEGTRVEALRIDGTQVFVDMAGDLSSQGGGLRATARLADVGLILPELSGPATADATIASGEEGWNVVAAVTGPGGIDAQATALVGVSGGLLDIPSDGPLPVDFDIDASVADLAPFSPFAGQALSGALDAQLSGNADVRALTFDIALDGTARDLRAAPAVPNALLAGETRLVLQASNGADGLEIGRLTVDGTQITLDASGDLTTGGNGLSATARLANLGLLTDAIQGPASVTAEVARATQGWDIDANLRGPGGLTARTRGLVGLDGGRVDITANGSAPLALANRFIAPRSVNGQLSFDIAVRGQPGLGAVSGRFSTTGARVAAPTFRLAVENLGLDGSLSGGRVSFNGTGNVSSGGRLGLSGTVDVGGPGIPGAVDITLNGVRLVDPSLYEVLLAQGALSVTGPLSVAPRVAGRIDLGQSEIRVPETGLGSAPPSPTSAMSVRPARNAAHARRRGFWHVKAAPAGQGPWVSTLRSTRRAASSCAGAASTRNSAAASESRATSAAVIPSGQFDLIRGRISILGTRLDLTEGSATLQGDFDPFLRLSAESRAGGYRIIISVEGPASAPDITLSSDPFLPEDEILAQLLFGRSVSALSPVQLLQLADAASSSGRRQHQWRAPVEPARRSRPRRSGPADRRRRQRRRARRAVPVGQHLHRCHRGGEGESALSLNIDLTPDITARGSFSSDGSSGVGVFFERDYY